MRLYEFSAHLSQSLNDSSEQDVVFSDRVNDSTHTCPILSSSCQWPRRSTRVSPAQIVKRSWRWRQPLYTDPLPWLWKRNPKRNERAPRKGLLLWAKPTDKCPSLASSRGNKLPFLGGQRFGVVKGRDQEVLTFTYCVSSASSSPHLYQDYISILWGVYYFWFLTKRKSPTSRMQKI